MKYLLRRLHILLPTISFLASCASTTTPAAPAGGCDPAQCAAKNECIDDGKETKCRLPCTAHGDCPFNYACALNSAKNFCAKTTLDLPRKPTGQWGTTCLPSGGEADNAACDKETGFACFGTDPSDATSYCTRFECETDLDCAGGYWCGTVNLKPNVGAPQRTFGPTRKVCLKRAYCAPCAADFDCPVVDGKQLRCASDAAGGKFCATPCSNNSNCRLDAACVGDALGDGTKVCRPNAGVCRGDGSVCSPCFSDADCPNGACLKAAYSPERFCSVKSKSACTATGQGSIVKGDCPAFSGFAGTKIGCQGSSADDNIPKDHCIGLIEFGDTGDIACYTKH